MCVEFKILRSFIYMNFFGCINKYLLIIIIISSEIATDWKLVKILISFRVMFFFIMYSIRIRVI